MIAAYVIGVLLWAAWRGYQTPIADANRVMLAFAILGSIFWPISLAIVFGASLRMFSAKKLAEDGGYRP